MFCRDINSLLCYCLLRQTRFSDQIYLGNVSSHLHYSVEMGFFTVRLLSVTYACVLWVFTRNTWCVTASMASGKESAFSAGNTGDLDLIPGLGGSPGVGNGNPLQYSCLGNAMDRGARWATVHWVAKSWTWFRLTSNSNL